MTDLIDRKLLNDFQRDFPLTSRPYKAMAERLGLEESEVIERLKALRDDGAVSRVGAVFRPNTVGASTLAAMAAPPEDLERVAALVSGYPQVNHNYQREHLLNLWFVVAASSKAEIQAVLAEISAHTGLRVLDLPMEQDFHLDLGFSLSWN